MSQLMTYGASQEDCQGTNSVKVILESESWRFISTKARIGVYSKADSSREFTIKVTEL
jgi:hypothetical protein